MYTLSANALKALTKLEGFKPSVYKDSAGLLTIGVGHLLTQAELASGQLDALGTQWKDGLSNDTVLALLNRDLARFVVAVNDATTVRLYQHEFDALVSFSFNVGVSAYEKSTLLKKLNLGQYTEAPMEFRKWNKAGGRVVQGLVNRREAEIKMWSDGVY